MNYRVSLLLIATVLFSLSAQAQLQKIYTLAGNGTAGFFGDGANASGAQLWGPIDLTLDTSGNLYFVDLNNFRIREVNTASVITTVAGNGIAGNTGNGSIATSADIIARGIAADRRGNIYFSDDVENIIRKVNRYGIISKVAGGGPLGNAYGYSGDGGKADTARLHMPRGLAVDAKGNLYFADAGNNVIRKIDTFGKITTVVGTGTAGFFGDGGLATFAELDSPYAVTIDRWGFMFINDYNNALIRIVDTTNTIYSYAGTYGLWGNGGDGGPASLAYFDHPRGIAVDTSGNLFIADAGNNVIRMVDRASTTIITAVGNGSAGFMGDYSYVNGCNLDNPYGVAVDKHGSIYIADANNNRVRKTYSTVGVNNVPVSSVAIHVFPNPCYGSISVSGLAVSDKVCISDVTGRVANPVWTVSSVSQSFDVSGLSSGIYFLQVSDSEGMRKATVKLVKE